MKRLLTVLSLMLLVSSAGAIDADKAFDDPELQARYEKMISEVRCLKCQNQSIKDSNVFLAADLRREIRRLIEEGIPLRGIGRPFRKPNRPDSLIGARRQRQHREVVVRPRVPGGGFAPQDRPRGAGDGPRDRAR